MDWLYADVVHADAPRQDAIKHIPGGGTADGRVFELSDLRTL
jgi:hypothetical protein